MCVCRWEQSLFPYPIPQSAMDLVQRLLVPDPKMRYTCQKAIEHRYFAEEPRAPSSPEELGTLNLTPGSSLHEYQTKKAKRAAKAAQDGGGQLFGSLCVFVLFVCLVGWLLACLFVLLVCLTQSFFVWL